MNTTNPLSVSIFTKISSRIIKEQFSLIGPLAWEEAKKVNGLQVIDQKLSKIELVGNEKEIVNNLVGQYSRLFGKISIEACKEAVHDLIGELDSDQIPERLK